jgi:glutamate synthase domain-containing protein 2
MKKADVFRRRALFRLAIGLLSGWVVAQAAARGEEAEFVKYALVCTRSVCVRACMVTCGRGCAYQEPEGERPVPQDLPQACNGANQALVP